VQERALRFFEFLFLLVLACCIAKLLLGPIHPRLTYPALAAVGLGVLVASIVGDGLRFAYRRTLMCTHRLPSRMTGRISITP
jgi:hypothetical protein